jgi:hypothetical protein
MAAPATAPVGAPALATLKAVQQAMLHKLQGSALGKPDVAKLRLQPMLKQQCESLGLPVARAGFKIPYFKLTGAPSNFFRYRYLEYGKDHGFAALTVGEKLLRYAQQPDTINEIYLPPYLNWRTYAKDATKPLVITEGELKAACTTKAGLPCVGLGGVWCFRSASHGMHLLPMFTEFAWTEREVYIVYDSDAASNPNVMQAENALARELTTLGAKPRVVRMPALAADGKTGLDDYIVARGITNLRDTVLTTAVEWLPSKELYQLNEEVLYVTDPGLVLRVDNMQRMSPRAFMDHAYAPRVYHVTQMDEKGNTKIIEKSAAKEWIKWPSRATVRRVTYAPGEPQVTVHGEFNTWRGWAVQPEEGNIAPWVELLDYLFGDEDESREWFERWLAYPLQHPGVKLYTAAVLWGLVHGTGKSLVGYTMFSIYGSNATEIGDRDLHMAYNEWAENKQFIMADEIVGGDAKRYTADRMKSMITQKQLRLNPKYVPSYTVPDCINYYFTSNHPDAFFLEDSDRRFFVHEVAGEPLPQAFYHGYAAWLKNGGAAALFAHLLQLDTSTWQPTQHAPVTSSKQEMISTGRSDVANWVANLREFPDDVLQVAGRKMPYKLWATKELHALYDPSGTGKVSVNGLARELRRGGFKKVFRNMPVLTERGGGQRLWAVRDREALDKIHNGALLAKMYDDERLLLEGKAKGVKF